MSFAAKVITVVVVLVLAYFILAYFLVKSGSGGRSGLSGVADTFSASGGFAHGFWDALTLSSGYSPQDQGASTSDTSVLIPSFSLGGLKAAEISGPPIFAKGQ